MIRPRDSQRSKLYKAERQISAWDRDRLETVDEMQRFVNKMLCSSWLHKHVKLVHCHSIKVLDGRRHKKAAAYDDAIAMPRWSRCKLIVIHEVCHILIKRIHGRNGVAAHGREYAKLFAELVQHFMSVEDAEQLRAAFKRNKVKYSLPRVPQIFKEKREMPQAAIEALKKWRETKAAERKTI